MESWSTFPDVTIDWVPLLPNLASKERIPTLFDVLSDENDAEWVVVRRKNRKPRGCHSPCHLEGICPSVGPPLEDAYLSLDFRVLRSPSQPPGNSSYASVLSTACVRIPEALHVHHSAAAERVEISSSVKLSTIVKTLLTSPLRLGHLPEKNYLPVLRRKFLEKWQLF